MSRKLLYPETAVRCTIYKHFDDDNVAFEKLEKPTNLQLDPRPTFIKLGAVSSVKGSAYMEYGNTKVMASVDPPHDINKTVRRSTTTLGVVNCSVKYASFATDDNSTIERKQNYLSLALKKALEPLICRNLFPNFELEIRVLILDDDGCALSTAITCAGLALTEAGIATYDLITASTVCFLKGVEFVNPNANVEQLLASNINNETVEEHGILVIASLSQLNQVTQCYQKGYLSLETLERLSDHSLSLNERILETVRHVLVNKVKQKIVEDETE